MKEDIKQLRMLYKDSNFHKEEKMNKLKEFRALELMCDSLTKIIELHRLGVERYEDVLVRAYNLKKHIEDLIKKYMKNLKKHSPKKVNNQKMKGGVV